MRRVARKAMVTAGFRCPEMRIVADTATARMIPCANAAMSNGLRFDMVADMIDPPPTKTRAKMPMNSAMK